MRYLLIGIFVGNAFDHGHYVLGAVIVTAAIVWRIHDYGTGKARA